MNFLLRSVVNAPDGTGRLAQVADFTVAGKTGTAQMVNPATGTYYQSRLVSSFVGFVPAQDPRLVILVVLYDVQHCHFGGLYAAPVFSEIAASALRHLSVAPDSSSHTTASLIPLVPAALAGTISDETDQTAGAPVLTADDRVSVSRGLSSTGPSPGADENSIPGLTPDFHGLSLRSAFALARTRRLNLESAGAGYVTKQKPLAGSPIDGRPVQLVLAGNTTPDGTKLISMTGRPVSRHAKATTHQSKTRGSAR